MLGNAQISAVLPVVDLERARKFYEETLGLRVKEQLPQDHVLFESGQGTTLLIYKRAATKADHTAAAFWVQDLESEMNELRSKKGLVFEEYDFPGLKTVNGVATFDSTKSAWFKDTEGNIIGISEKI